jgi:hypothetical protein
MAMKAIMISPLPFPEEVGMKTGATIHTMNGFTNVARKLNQERDPRETDGWWEKQHWKRGVECDW